MRRLILAALVSAVIFGIYSTPLEKVAAHPLPAPLASASDLIQQVNQLRAANGLQPYRVNNALMAAAQAHSEYQAATGSSSHSGKGGSRPGDRAVAYGYGGGASVYVSENIASGTGLSAAQAVGWWQGDNLHLTTMLSGNYRDAGAGAAEANGVVYYTLDVGYIAGEQGQPSSSQPGSKGSSSNPSAGQQAPAGTPVALLVPIQAATPNTDGSIVHEVQWGQFLYNIADAYKVDLPFLLALNNIKADTVIYPGDKLLIRPANPTPMVEASPTAANTAPASATRTPAVSSGAQSRVIETAVLTATPQDAQPAGTPIAAAGAPSSAEPAASGSDQANAGSASLDGSPAGSRPALDPILVAIGGLIVLGTALLLFGGMVNRRPRSPDE